MFMVKGEYTNIINLLKVKLRTNSKNFIWFPIIAALMFFGSLANTITGILYNGGEGIKFYQVTDYSTSFFLGMVFAYIIIMFLYRRINDRLSVFPQANTARFITSQAVNYIVVVWVGLSTLVLYLLYYGVVKIFSLFYGSVYFAFDFSIGFIAAGFFTFLLYGFLIVAVIDLIGVILRKWTYYAAIAFTALIALAVTNIMIVVEYAPKVLAFLVKEPSFGLFTLKAILLWLAVTTISIVINYFTVYHKSQNSITKKYTVIICVVIAAVIMIGIPMVMFYSTTKSSGDSAWITTEEFSVDEIVLDYFARGHEIRIDVSHLSSGSSIRLEPIGENLSVIAEGGAFIYGQNRFTAYLSGTDALDNIQGDTIVIAFRPPFYNVNGFELAEFANPRITAHLEGGTLYIEYVIDDAHVVIMPIWSIAGQFDIFKDKNLVSENPIGFSSSGNSSANIFIRVE